MPIAPQGFPVAITFDLDAETMWTGGKPERAEMPITMSQGRYGPKIAMGRILDLLDREGIKATFFTPGAVVEDHPAVIEDMLKRGHELAHHSHTHPWLPKLSEAEEREEMEKGIAAIKAASGKAPVGYRSPHGEFGPATMNLIHEYGFGYSSNFFDDDSPYLHAKDGKATKLVELPYAWSLDDAPYFLFSAHHFGRVVQTPDAVLEVWKAEFDGLYAEDRMFMLVMHPQIIGRPSRMKMLERLIAYIRKHPNLWFARCDEIADTMRPRLAA